MAVARDQTTIRRSPPREWAQTDAPWVERHSGMSPETFRRDHLLPRKPVILTDVIGDWPALGRYNYAYFRQNHGGRTLRVQGREQKLVDVIDQLLSATPDRPGPYPCTLPGDATLHADLTPRFEHALPTRTGSALIPRSIFGAVNHLEVFFGGPGGQFPRLHYDMLHMHTWIAQAWGEKEFTFYAPGQEDVLYVNPVTPWLSMVKNVDNPDTKQFPLLRDARKQSVVLRAGEAMFIPCGTWHTARCVTDNITVAFDFLESTNWRDFVRDAAAIRRSAGQPVKAAMLAAWLSFVGPLLDIKEAMTPRRHGSGWH